MHRASSVYRVIKTVPLLFFSRLLSFSLIFTAPLDQIVKRECSDENQYQITSCCSCIDTAGNRNNWTCYPASRRMRNSTRVETPVIIGPSRTPRVGWTQKREPKKNKKIKKGILGVRAKGRMDPGHRSKDLVWALEEKGQGFSLSGAKQFYRPFLSAFVCQGAQTGVITIDLRKPPLSCAFVGNWAFHSLLLAEYNHYHHYHPRHLRHWPNIDLVRDRPWFAYFLFYF